MEYSVDKINLDIRLKNNYTDDELTLLVNIGHSLETGNSLFEPDHGLALAVYGLAAQNGDATAMNNYGWMVLNGLGTPKNIDKAISAFEDAASKGNTTAMVNLGNIYENLENNAEAEFGNFNIINNSNFINLRVSNISEHVDYKKAVKWYKKAAENGNAKGAYNYALMLHDGRGIRKNRKKAFDIFYKLYKIRFLESAFFLGVYYQEGFGVSKNYDLARKYYINGATLGDIYCYNQLGTMYAKGLGVKQDFNFALEYYNTAAELGDSLSMANIGWMYLNGDGVAQNYKEAVKWYERAIEKGFRLENESAGPLNTLGCIYQNGLGVEQDYQKAIELYNKSAALDNSDAQTNLGVMYENGYGFIKNLESAVYWYKKAAEQGDTDASDALTRLVE